MKSAGIKEILEQHNSVEQILNAAKQERWPYPKTFDLLKELGVNSYTVKFIDGYDASYYGIDGGVLYKEEPPEGYHRLQATRQFSPKMVENAIITHARDKTSFFSFLDGIANAGASHYVVDMKTRMVTYNDSQDQFYAESVPDWNWDLE